MKVVNVQQARDHLSELVLEAESGQEVVIARRGTPVVRLTPVTAPQERVLGFLPGLVPESFFEALPEEELAAWES